MRLFVALPPPAGFLDRLDEALFPLRSRRRDLRWVPRENTHITLAFLGEVDSRGASLVDAVLRDITGMIKPIAFTAEKFIALPGAGRATVLALGVAEGRERISQGASFFEQRLAGAAVEGHYPFRPREKRPFTPHITVARSGRGFTLAPEERLPLHLGGVLEEAVLFQSELRKTGPIYTPLGVYRFTGGNFDANSP
ncbi:MAG: RNA 2',3'-cyclic phosphodiesterase [Spirochaetaceae bacterium]|jgi:2'-5' RNA ligase|nr:RNA 2',3'-cyclic phosphodiesterase [Spirochaetaceae bacterium]